MKNKKISFKTQRIVADILTRFMFTQNMEDVNKVWVQIYEEYNLCDDPFTHTPCSFPDFVDSKMEYAKLIMIEKFGHCDGYD